MSLLLDALNKADQERKRNNEAAPGINSNHEQLNDHGPRNHSILLIAVIVVGLLILLAAIYWLGQRSTATPVATTPTPTPVVAQPKTAPRIASKNSTVSSEVKSADANTNSSNTKIETESETPDESVANLYQNTQVPQSNAAITISTPPAGTLAQPVVEAPPVSAPNIPSPTSITQFANLPEIHDLPNNILQKIPSLGYSEHNYTVNGASVKINGEIKHVNDQLPSGIVIDKILEDGMILHIENYSFKMRAMNSWVNM